MSAAPRCLITGASGLLGRALMRAFTAASTESKAAAAVKWECTGAAFSRASKNLIKVDLRDAKAVRELVTKLKPNVIVHAAAERFPDKVEADKEAAQKLNVEATRELASAAKEVGAWLLYISTDYVFDGKASPYKTSDKPNPLNTYGALKLGGEQAVLKELPSAVVLRVPFLYGSVECATQLALRHGH